MEIWTSVWPYVAGLLPTVGLCFLFYEVMKHIVEGDRRERAAVAEWESSRRTESENPPESRQGIVGERARSDSASGVDFHGDHY